MTAPAVIHPVIKPADDTVEDGKPMFPQAVTRRCGCGATFRTRNPRQVECPACSPGWVLPWAD